MYLCIKGAERMDFGDFAGNEAVKKQLSSLVDSGRFPHALLLEGEVGSGRRTMAMRLARAAVCTGSRRPCGQCAACQKTTHPDIAVIGGEGSSLPVDTIRELRQDAYTMPNESAYRVFILPDAQAMTPQAQNALLKILEEPPAHVLFFLTCENRTQLLQTIRSRCVAVTMQPVSYEAAAPVLRRRLPTADEAQLCRAHSLFGGRIGRVLDGIGDGTLQQVLELLPQMAEAITATAELPLLSLIGRLEKDKPLTEGVLAGLTLILRDALAARSGSPLRLSTAPEEAAAMAGRLTGRRLAALLQAVEGLQADLRRNMNNTLFLTRMSACLRQAAGY